MYEGTNAIITVGASANYSAGPRAFHGYCRWCLLTVFHAISGAARGEIDPWWVNKKFKMSGVGEFVASSSIGARKHRGRIM